MAMSSTGRQASSEAMGLERHAGACAPRWHNRGARAMREVAQLYIHQRVAAIARPVRELRGFKAVELQPGETATVEFQIRRLDLAYVGAEGKAVVEPGWFDVVIAPSAVGGASVALRLLANRA
jgi:beta-glucosidase